MKMMLCLIGAIVAVGVMTALAAIEAKVLVPRAQAKTVPGSLTDVGEFGENIYDLAKANDWTKAAEKFKALKEAAKKLAGDLKGAAELKRLDRCVAALEIAIPAKEREATLLVANQVTLIAADLVEPFNPQVPAAVTRLDFYGRELEIGVAAKDSAGRLAGLKVTGDLLRQTWDKIQPAVKAKGGEAEAKKFSGLMTQVGAAKSVEDYGKLVAPILDEVDNLEKVFTTKKEAEVVVTGQGKTEEWTTDFGVSKDELTHTGRNIYFILEPGNYVVLVDGDERLTVTVLNETKLVDGVETRIVEEKETKGGKLVEISRNYYAISKKTSSVFYFGEDVDWYKDGKVSGHDGSWLSGVKGAKFGLMMPGTPLLKAKYHQEIATGAAMDRAEIVSLTQTVVTPAGTFTKCLKTEETSGLEPGTKEYKLYAPGIGLIGDTSMRLVEHGFVKKK